jgi:hypothetical protein
MQPGNPDGAEQLRRLAHELAEALTATGNCLHACHHLQSSDPASSARLREAISMAIKQNKRAGEVVVRLRAIAAR